ncbi:antibiotic biosynthesis monooxygenase [Neptuniibacter sp. CAU 1671]|uniref:antibiotic biosynthesis monooxygenase n=1 Tax=Neptuniibacter sp. CAU 1671 TaxID=3032593 RepID=UPI0023DBBFEF|nr:antibiotic biosynthesis monooxygenase [Neptuniibacter sp. CAU 1671]MDF2180596.1 antibiotic biosynthesis monooxygenase [Neptuniibacter sp. CAU 1671]
MAGSSDQTSVTDTAQRSVCQPGDEGPVTVSISRRVKPGRESDYEQWISGVIEAAGEYPGHLGTSVLRPGPATRHEYVLIYRFDNYEHCQQWEQSYLRKQWLDKLEGMTEGDATTVRGTGLEFWFDLPELPAHQPPSPAKMALVLVVVVFVLIMGINLLFKPWLDLLPLWLHTLLVVIGQVLLMTYVVMPRVTKLLKNWLFKR